MTPTQMTAMDDVLDDIRAERLRVCAFPDCGRAHYAKWLCRSHYERARCGSKLRPIGMGFRPNEVVMRGDYAEVVLTRHGGHEAGRALVDVSDLEHVCARRWCADKEGYVVSGRAPRVQLHRIIMQPPQHLHVDHRNGNPLDNRRANLLVVEQRLNNHNQAVNRRNSSGYRGVHWQKQRQLWRAQVQHKGRTICIGHFEDVHEAGRAAHEARERLFENHQTRQRGAE